MKAKTQAMQIKAGVFITVGLLLGMMVIFLLGKESQLFTRHYDLVAYFPDINGLREGTLVQLAGIPVGTVKEIKFEDELKNAKIKLRLRMMKKYQERIRANSVATIVTQGLLGDKMLAITVGDPTNAELKDGDEIKTSSGSGISEVIAQSERAIKQVEEMGRQINEILNEVRTGKGIAHELVYSPRGESMMKNADELTLHLNQTSFYLTEVLGKVNRGEGTIGALVNDASLFNDIKMLLGKANRNKLVKAAIRETLRTNDPTEAESK